MYILRGQKGIGGLRGHWEAFRGVGVFRAITGYQGVWGVRSVWDW